MRTSRGFFLPSSGGKTRFVEEQEVIQPGLNERWQIFHNSYPDGVMSRITNDLDSCGSIQLTDFNVPEKSYRLPSPPMAGGSHRAATTTSEVLLIKNFQARN